MFKFDKLVFGDLGWGDEFLFATLMTITVSILSMGLGLCLAILTVWAKLITILICGGNSKPCISVLRSIKAPSDFT